MVDNPGLLKACFVRGNAARIVRSHQPGGLSVQQLADRLGLSVEQVNEMEAGDFSAPRASQIYLDYLAPGGTWDDVISKARETVKERDSEKAAALPTPPASDGETGIARHHTPAQLLADLPSFGAMVLRVRNLQGSQMAVSEGKNFSRFTLVKVERGKEEYSSRTARNICEALGMTQQDIDPQLWLAHKYVSLGLPLRSEETEMNLFIPRPAIHTGTPPVEDFLLNLPSFAGMVKEVMRKLDIKPTKFNTRCERTTVYKALNTNENVQMETARDICEALGMPKDTVNPYAWLAGSYMSPPVARSAEAQPAPQPSAGQLQMIALLSEVPAFHVMVKEVRNTMGTRESLLERAGIDRTTWGKVERGGECRAATARKICEALGMKEKQIDPQYWLAHQYLALGLPLRSGEKREHGKMNDSPARFREDFLLTLPSFGDMLAAVKNNQHLTLEQIQQGGLNRSTLWKVLKCSEASTTTARDICKGLGMPDDAPNPHMWLAQHYIELGLPPVQPRSHGFQR